MKISQNELKRALELAQSQVTQETVNRVSDIEMPERPEEEWERLYREGRRRRGAGKRRRVQKAAGFILVLLLVSLSTVMTTEAGWGKLVQWFVKEGEIEDEYYFMRDIDMTNMKDAPPTKIETVYAPTYIPEGFRQTYMSDGQHSYIETYEKGEDDVHYQQMTLDGKLGVDSEDTIRETVEIRGNEGHLNYKEGTTILVWKTSEYAFVICSSLDKDTVLKIAESVGERER